MADEIAGSPANPIIIKEPFTLKWLVGLSLFSNEPKRAEIVRAVTPVILSSVEVGQTFTFFSKPDNKFTLLKGPDNNYYILPNPSQVNSAKIYLEVEDMSEYAKIKEKVNNAWKTLTNPVKDFENGINKFFDK